MKNKLENEQIEIKEIKGSNDLIEIEQYSKKLFHQLLKLYKIPRYFFTNEENKKKERM